MGMPKGRTGNPLGKPKGTPNRTTLQGREAIAAFVEGNAARLNGWLEAIAKDSPIEAFKAFMSVVEYHLPKIARLEHTGKDGERLQINVVTGVPAVEAEFIEVGKIGPPISSPPAVDVEAVASLLSDPAIEPTHEPSE